MVLGQRTVTRNSKGPRFQLDYIIHIQDIRPWPPSPQLQSLRSVVIHWENGEHCSGSTRPVTPSLGSVPDDGKIEFNESFQLSVTLLRDMSARKGNTIAFQKNFLTFNMYEPRRDNILKGQLIGTAIADLADYGIVDEPLSVIASLNCKRSFRNMVQPFLHIVIQPIEKGQARSLSSGSPSIELSVGEHDSESILASLNEEFAEEAGMISFTQNDFSSFPPETSDGILPIQDEQVKMETETFSGISADHLEDTAAVYENELEDHCLHLVEGRRSIDERPSLLLTDNSDEQAYPGNGAFSFRWDGLRLKDDPPSIDDESVESPLDTAMSDRFRSRELLMGQRHSWGTRRSGFNERKEAKMYSKDQKVESTGARVQQLEHRIHDLEGELREVAALEVALYSVAAEHGNSSATVHAPARRLALLYHHACTEISQSTRASAARSSLSGLTLVAKACGNDAPRLTYWLSNCAVLRSILSCKILKGSFLTHQSSDSDGKESFSTERGKKKDKKFHSSEDLLAFINGLEKIEAWIFSRVVESIWWQILIPHMQPVARKTSSKDKDSCGSNESNGKVEAQAEDQMQANLSLEHWKRAFTEARERVCPARAGGHACGCLPVLDRLIMEQCAARLDVAMFNAILRKSADEIPADPQSDPITDLKVLPIPAGKLSFKSGVQLKHVIGNWSRWFTDHYSIEDEDLSEDGGEISKYGSQGKQFESFRLLSALSNLLMLPKDLLSSEPVRKEVCPTLGAPLIWRVLENFIPDEFCPHPLPEAVLEALATEECTSEADEDSFTGYPCAAAPPVYSLPSAASIPGALNDDFLKKPQGSDDEVDELTSLLASVLIDGFLSSPTSTIPGSILKENVSGNALRYKLLRDIWMDSSM